MLINILLALVAVTAVLAYLKVERESGDLRAEKARLKAALDGANDRFAQLCDELDHWRNAFNREQVAGDDRTRVLLEEIAKIASMTPRQMMFPDEDGDPPSIGAADKLEMQRRRAAKTDPVTRVPESGMTAITPSDTPRAPRD